MTKAVGYNTGLAAEFYVLSVLHRKGLSASMTLGNRKAIDIVVEAPDRTITIDVKGMASRTNWPLDNFSSEKLENHYVALVTFNNRIKDHSVLPTVYLVPAADIPLFFYVNPKGNRRTIQFSRMRDQGSQYLEAWSAFEVQPTKLETTATRGASRKGSLKHSIEKALPGKRGRASHVKP
jgi:hypothetical protein